MLTPESADKLVWVIGLAGVYDGEHACGQTNGCSLFMCSCQQLCL